MNRRDFGREALCGLLLPSLANAATVAPQPLSFLFDQDAFPTQYSSRGGASAGVYPGIVSELCKQAELPALNVAAPFKRVVAGYLSGTSAGGALIKTPERLGVGVYTRPYYVERLRPYFSRKLSKPIRSVADLEGLRVGVIRGWAYGEAFDEARRLGYIRAEEVASGFQNFMKLQRGRLDCVVETELAAALFMPLLTDFEVVAGEFFLLQAPIHVAIARHLEDAQAIVARLDKAIVEVSRADGIQQIVDRELREASAYMPAWLREHRLV